MEAENVRIDTERNREIKGAPKELNAMETKMPKKQQEAFLKGTSKDGKRAESNVG